MALAGQQQIRTQDPPMFANLAYQVSRSGTTVTYSLGVGIWTSDKYGWRNNRIACEFIVNGTSLGANRTVKAQTSGAIGTTPYWPTKDESSTASSHTASLDNPYYLYSNRTFTLDGGAESFSVSVRIRETGYGTGMDGTYSWNTPSIDYGTFTWSIPVSKATYNVGINHWSWGFKNSEGNNGDKRAFHLQDTSFSVTHGTNYTMDASRGISIPNGFYLRNEFGGSAVAGSWVIYTMPQTFAAGAHGWEYDYDPVTYTITYTMNGGSNNSSNPSTYTVLYGVSFANPSRTGYRFSNWTIGGTVVTGINPGANASFSSVSDLRTKCSSRTTGNKTVVANWTANDYTVVYNANCSDSSGSMATTAAKYDSAFNLRSNAYTRQHYTFKNWNTKADGTGTAYTNAQSVKNLTATHNGTVTLYAQWTGKTYTVSYDANEGTSTPASHSVQYPGSLTLRSGISKSNTTKSGYTVTYNANGGSGAPGNQTSGNRTVTWTFYRWAKGNKDGPTYEAGKPFAPTSDTVMYATWTSEEKQESQWTCSSTKPIRTGHTFLGWSKDSGATSATYTSGTEYTITSGLTLYAVWQKNSYYLDVNGYLDGVEESSLGSYGTVDVYVNGTAVGNDVNDYYTQHPYGSSYEIKDIKPSSGYQYNGLQSGTLTGTIGNNEKTTGVRVNFSTIKPSNVTLSGNWTSPFNINLNWSATGLSVKYVLYYKKSTDSNYTSIDCSTTTNKAFTAEEETTYSFYIAATNAGGTTNSNTITITTPADQAKIRRKVDGTWVKGKAYLKEEGAWIKAKKIYIKRDGVWYINTNYDS